jgi:hypothetical protein
MSMGLTTRKSLLLVALLCIVCFFAAEAATRCSPEKMKKLKESAALASRSCTEAESIECQTHLQTYYDLVEECSNHKKNVAAEHAAEKERLVKRGRRCLCACRSSLLRHV